MVNALFVNLIGVDDVHDGLSQMCCVGGSSNLVENDIERLASSGKVEHCEQEVATIRAVKPCRANDDVSTTTIDDSSFAGKFGEYVGKTHHRS